MSPYRVHVIDTRLGGGVARIGLPALDKRNLACAEFCALPRGGADGDKESCEEAIYGDSPVGSEGTCYGQEAGVQARKGD